jgi:hypothetical protein
LSHHCFQPSSRSVWRHAGSRHLRFGW